MNLTKCCKFTRVQNGATAGTGDVLTSTAVDMSDFESVTFAVAVGTITGAGTCAVQVMQSAAADLGTPDTLTGAVHTLVTADSDKVLLIEVERPTKQYVYVTLTRAGGANTVVDGVIAIQCGPRVLPVTQPATVHATVFTLSPAAA
jgi:hypothetical protein